MEWVETTGRTIEDAKEAALDELGVDESDAEFEVLEEARAGLFGRLRSEARVRARVRPTAPRAKEDRRDRRRRGRQPGRARQRASGHRRRRAAPRATAGRGRGRRAAGLAPGATGGRPATPRRVRRRRTGGPTAAAAAQAARRSHRRRRGGTGRRAKPAQAADALEPIDREEAQSAGQELPRVENGEVEVALEEQGRVAQEFLTRAHGGVRRPGIGRASSDPTRTPSTCTCEGSDLGLLIGPKGSTLLAIQDLTRTAVVHHQTGAGNGRIHVDVGGYRQKRAEALAPLRPAGGDHRQAERYPHRPGTHVRGRPQGSP